MYIGSVNWTGIIVGLTTIAAICAFVLSAGAPYIGGG